jgi:hypothetical protein
MSSTSKPPDNPAAPNSPPAGNLPTEFTDLFIKGVQRAAEMQKSSLDAAAQQNAQILESYKQSSQVMPGAAGMFELAGQAFERYVEAQKTVIDQIVEQTTKERSNSASKATAEFTRVLQQSVERAVEVQKKAIDLAAQQAKDMSEAGKRQFGISGTPLAAATDSFQRGVDAALESHKEMLDAATRSLKKPPKP